MDVIPDLKGSDRYDIYMDVIQKQQRQEIDQIVNNPTLGRRTGDWVAAEPRGTQAAHFGLAAEKRCYPRGRLHAYPALFRFALELSTYELPPLAAL